MRFRELALEIILRVCKWTNFEWGITIFSCTVNPLKETKISQNYIYIYNFWILILLQIFWNIEKKKWVDVFFKENVLESWELKWSVPDSETCLQLFFELFREMKKVFWVVFQSYQLLLCSNQELGTWHVSISLLNDLLNLFCALGFASLNDLRTSDQGKRILTRLALPSWKN